MARLIEQSPVFYQTDLANYSQVCFGLYPLSEWDVSVIMSSLRAASWHSRWLEDNGERVSVVDYQENLTTIESLEYRLMSNCLDDLVAVMDEIKSAIMAGNSIAQNCCVGTGGGFISDGAGGFFYGSEEPITPPALPTPDEISQRCLGANLIVEGLIATLNTMSSYSLAVLILGTIVSFFVAPPAVAVLVTITALAGFGLDVFEDIADDIESNKAEWVCVLYSAGSYSTVVAFIEEQAVAISDALSFSILGVPLGQMLASMIPTNVFNQMFQEVGFLPPASSPVSCAGCVQDDIWACVASVSCGGAGVQGTITSGNPNNGEACTVTSATYWWGCNPGTSVPFIIIEGIVDIQITAFSSSINLRYWDELGTVAYYQLSNTTSPVGTSLAAGNQLYIMRNDGGSGAFTIDITVEI